MHSRAYFEQFPPLRRGMSYFFLLPVFAFLWLASTPYVEQPLAVSQLTGELVDKNLGQRITTLGFIHSDGEGRLFLAGEANLRSCCVGKNRLGIPQLLIKEIDPSQAKELYAKAVYATGYLSLEKEQLTLSEATLSLANGETSDPYLHLGWLIPICLILYVLFRKGYR